MQVRLNTVRAATMLRCFAAVKRDDRRRSPCSETQKWFSSDQEIPRQWYNIQADLPTPVSPPLHPGTLKPIGPQDLAPVFPYEPHRAGSQH